ncbi:MAG: dockerin type I repeat-containing protein [Planctomycetota bacterium]
MEISQLIRVTGHLRGDLSGDGYVDGTDIGLMLAAYGMDNLPMADLNGDGVVTSADLGLLLAQWRIPEPPPAGQNVTSKWLPVPISASCAEELADVRSADLYLAFDLEPENLRFVVASTDEHNLRIEGGTFYQNTTFGDNLIPDEGFFSLDPCVAYDSYLTVGDTEIFLVGTSLNKDDWGNTLVANWFSSEIDDTSAISVEQDPAKFGDSKFYIRIARITASLGSTHVGGSIELNDAGTLHLVDIPHESSIWGDFDFNDDASVDYLDAMMIKDAVALSSTDTVFDLDGNGDIDGDDLRMFLIAFPEFE